MNTQAVGRKLGFQVADYAKKYGYGIGSFRLKDGSSVKILQNADKNMVELWNVQNGRLLGLKGYKGKESVFEAQQAVCRLENLAENPEELTSAWAQSLYKSSL
ncbi:hypothetical protein IJ541_06920 [bacterium]|nr:hypothetical protein [bacterium]